MKKILILLFCAISVAQAQQGGTVNIRFDHFVGSEVLNLDTHTYKNAAGNEFKVSLFQYFVSNIKLLKKDGSAYTVPQDKSYFLIKESNEDSKTITLTDIPKGVYTGVSFLIGVDSARSASDISQRKGSLDVAGEAQDMYWAWNSGYIFVKMEGVSAQASSSNNVFMYHIGLFGGIGVKKTLNNIKYANVSFGKEPLKVQSGKNAPVIVLIADAMKLLNGPNKIDMAENPSIMGGPFSTKVAENYQSMFSFSGFLPPIKAAK
ncbi:MbnP family protein [Emticicia soli]|uniref:MbnP family protein n=1 Tax=Emticicia soli TaxID=2027878 RepID=A0ABW5JCM1_9BACT